MRGGNVGGRLLRALVLVALFGCGEEGGGTPSYVMDATESGTPWARNSGEGSWTDSERWTASVGLMLGAIGGDGADVFGSIRALAISPAGDLFVLDEQAQEVRVFDSAGRHLRTFGRRGQGPGEFGYADGISFDPEGLLWALDARPWRLSAFTTDGAFVRSVPSLPVPGDGEVLSDGTMVFWAFSNPGRDYSGLGAGLGNLSLYQPLRVSLEDGTVDSLTAHEVTYPMVGEHRIPLSVQVTFAQDPRGPVWISHGSEYTLYKRTLEGDTLLVVSVEGVVPVAVTARQADSIIEAGQSRLRSTNQILRSRNLPAVDEGFVSRTDLPEHHPIIDWILVDGVGRVLVVPRLDGYEVGTIVDVFDDETGRYFGRVDLPVPISRSGAARLVPGRLWAVVPGEYDVPRIARIDLEPMS